MIVAVANKTKGVKVKDSIYVLNLEANNKQAA